LIFFYILFLKLIKSALNNALVIIPTFNEKENISDIIDAVLALEITFDVLVVDDNSPDGTADIVKQKIAANGNRIQIVERKGKHGLGTAYLEGFRFGLSKGYDYLFEMDADFSHNPNDLIKLYNSCAVDGNDLAIGSRYVTGVNVVNWPMSRVLMSFFASKYVRLITGMPIQDTTAGFKCFKREVLETINLNRIKFVGYAFQIEMKFKTWKHGFKVYEVPIIFTDRTRGTSKMSTGIFKEAVLGVIQLKFKSFFKKYPKRK
jgi:dolichol-phosphate mannosyltransferase